MTLILVYTLSKTILGLSRKILECDDFSMDTRMGNGLETPILLLTRLFYGCLCYLIWLICCC